MAIDSVGFLKSSRKPIADLFLLKLVRLCFIKVWELNERHYIYIVFDCHYSDFQTMGNEFIEKIVPRIIIQTTTHILTYLYSQPTAA